jgi:hypothetical protein
MGMVVPFLFNPINVLVAIAFGCFAIAARRSGLGKTGAAVLWGITILIGVPSSMCGLIAFDYLVRGAYAQYAAISLASFALFAVCAWYAHHVHRASKRPRASGLR